MKITVPIALYGWPLIALVFFALLTPRRAVIATFVAGWLLLPAASIPIQGLPNVSKASSIALGALLGVLCFDARRLGSFRFRAIDLAALSLTIVPFVTSLTNGLGVYDGLSGALTGGLLWGVPWLMGRLYGADDNALHDLMMGLIVGSLAYVPICLFEIRMSPQLNRWLYGFIPFAFDSTKRFGGFRPVGFLNHGIELGTLMMSGSLTALCFWVTGSRRRVMGVLVSWLTVPLTLVTILARAFGAWGLWSVGALVLLGMKTTRSGLPILLLILTPAVYIGTRLSGVLPDEQLTAPVAALSAERSESFGTRLSNESQLISKALERPVFGWGRWGRNRVYDEQGRDRSLTDGLWIILFGQQGFVGLATWLAIALVPPTLALRRIGVSALLAPTSAPVLAAIVLLPLQTVDWLFNGFVNPVSLMVAGSLVDAGRTARRAPRRTRAPRHLRRSRPEPLRAGPSSCEGRHDRLGTLPRSTTEAEARRVTESKRENPSRPAPVRHLLRACARSRVNTHLRVLLPLLFLPIASAAQVTGAVSANRTGGVAPLAVFFDATATRDGDPSVSAFHDLHYEWDFGDASGAWPVSGSPRGKAFGPVAGHVFEPASFPDDCGGGPRTCRRFSVDLVIRDRAGGHGVPPITIAVEDPEYRFATSTVCISRTADATGCPAGASQRLNQTGTFESILAAAIDSGGSRRVLFHAGQQWTHTTTYRINAPGPGLIGSFDSEGMCSAANPCTQKAVASFTPASGTGISFNDDDWRLSDLELRGIGSGTPMAVGFMHTKDHQGVDYNIRNTVLRLDVQGFLVGFSTSGAWPAPDVVTKELAIVENHYSAGVSGSGGNCVYVHARKLMLLGNDFDRGGAMEHVVRVALGEKAVISHNRLANPAATKHHLKVHASGATDGLVSKQIVISDNWFDGGHNPWVLAIGPSSGSADEVVEDVIVERNYFKASPETQIFVLIWGPGVTARSNVLDSTASSAGFISFLVDKRETQPQSVDVRDDRIYSNTCYSGSMNSQTCVLNGVGAVGSRVYDNLLFAPASQQRSVLADRGTGTSTAGNVDASLLPLPFTGPLASPVGFRLIPGSPLADAGVRVGEAVYADFGGALVSQGTAPGVGAWESGGPPLAPLLLQP